MDTKSPIILVLLFIIPVLSVKPPRPDYCDPSIGSEVRFPFRLADRASSPRGFPGFDLYCNSDNQTIIHLPDSGEFLVDHIDYSNQALFINDPDACLPARILNFSLSGSRFRGVYTRNYTFFNCSSDYMDNTSARFMPLLCLSGRNHTVVAVTSRLPAAAAEMPPTCRRIATVPVPMQWTMSQFHWSSMDLTEDLELAWSEPECWGCENEGGICGFRTDTGMEIGCFRPAKSRGLPRGARYGIIIGFGIPGLVGVIGLACYVCGMVRKFAIRPHQLNSHLPVTFSDQRSAGGLDRPTIESYPTTVLGESRRLPKLSDGTCPICLSDYQPKEMLRSIPDCCHYFHADCIEEWLKLNGTCPLCRKSAEGMPPCSSSLEMSSSPSVNWNRN